jgi:hypothetical protein
MNKKSLKDKLIKSLKTQVEWNNEKDAILKYEINWYLLHCPLEYFDTKSLCLLISKKIEGSNEDDILQRATELGLYG